MTSITDLREEAQALGITFAPATGVATLRKKIDDFLVAKETMTELSGVSKSVTDEELRREATVLVRVKLNTVNPAKSKYQGVYIQGGNALVGNIRKYIPFNEPWMMPQILINVAEEAKFTQFDARKMQRRLVKEYQIEILPPLTVEELKNLQDQQAILDKTQGD